MSATVTANCYQLITDVAKREHWLPHCVSKRLGVQMCEITIDAVRQRSLRSLCQAAEQVAHGQRRVERAAGVHLRARRKCTREGASLLATDGELRDWLAS